MKSVKFGIALNNCLRAKLIGLLLLINHSSVCAAEDHDLFFDMPIVLSANRLEQPVTTAAVSITVIDRETIIASGARTIPEVLRLVPGMQAGFSGNMFGDEPRYVVTYHGHSNQYSREMQVLIDGRSIYEPFLGVVNWKSMPVNISDIERIEVSRGPNLATYGANSFLGAINIITRTAAEDQGSFIQSNIGTDDIRDFTYRYGGSNGDLDYRITASTYNDSGLDSANEFDYPDDTESNNIDYRLDYQLDNKNTISYQGGYGRNYQQTDRNHNIDGDTGEPSPYPLARTVDNTYIFQFIKWENVINTKNTLLLQYYYNLSDKKDGSLSDPIILPIPGLEPATFDPITLDLDGSTRSARQNIELTHFYNPLNNLSLVWGLSGQFDSVTAPFYLGRNDAVTHNKFRIFGNAEWYVNQNNIINVGVLAEKNDITDSELSPRLSFTHIFNKHHNIRLGISQATRSLFMLEAELDTVVPLPLRVFNGQLPSQFIPGAPDSIDEQIWLGSVPGGYRLNNEKIISREIAYYGNFLDSALLFNARLFNDDISDYIELDGTEFINSFDSNTTGLEVELDYHIDPTLRLIASGAVINISCSTCKNDDIDNSAPHHSYSIMAMKKLNEKYSGSAAFYYVDAFKFTDSRGSGTNEYSTMDLRLSRSFIFDKVNGSLSVVLKNLLGDYTAYQEKPDYGAPKVIHTQLAYLDFRLMF